MKLHLLTDIHIGSQHHVPTSRIPGVLQDTVPHGNLDLYLDQLAQLGAHDLPDVIVLSGDLTSTATENEFNVAKDFIRNIGKTYSENGRVGEAGPHLVLVPGNHDLDWSKGSYEEKIARYRRLAEDVVRDVNLIGSPLPGQPQPSYASHMALGKYVFIGCLNSTRLGGTDDPELQQLHSTLDQLFGHGTPSAAQQAFAKIGQRIKIDPGYVFREDLDALCKSGRGLGTNWPGLRIAVTHHNPSAAPTRDIDAFDSIINAGIVKKSLSDAGFDLVLHGHRHVQHVSRELIPSLEDSKERSLLIIGGDALGDGPSGKFLELLIEPIALLGPEDNRSFIVDVFAVKAADPAKRAHVAHEIMSPPLDLVRQQIELASGGFKREVGALKLSDLDEYIRFLRQILVNYHAWDDAGSRGWITDFHRHLNDYNSVFATDVWNRSAVIAPRFDLYLAEQYRQRFLRIRQDDRRTLAFSRDVYEAVIRTKWSADPQLWAGVNPTQRESDAVGQEIVRILVRPGRADEDRHALANLDFNHRMYGIPLFVVSGDHEPDAADVPDFALGMKGGRIERTYEFDVSTKNVVPASQQRAHQLRRKFLAILRDPTLQTVEQYLGNESPMVRDATFVKQLARDYHIYRSASDSILSHLADLLDPRADDVGLDVGCGTGNYTLPFLEKFDRLVGLDLHEEFLDLARSKVSSPKLEWHLGSALVPHFPPKSFSKIWGISVLQYFLGDNQRLLFQEMYRILRPSGVLVFDTEFKEQHDSLWVTEFFPSLKERYQHSIFSTLEYGNLLQQAGFRDIGFSHLTMKAHDGDFGVRLGQHEPSLYLHLDKLKAIPAFVDMSDEEREQGLMSLQTAISDGSINNTISEYAQKATMDGDVGFIRAVK